MAGHARFSMSNEVLWTQSTECVPVELKFRPYVSEGEDATRFFSFDANRR